MMMRQKLRVLLGLGTWLAIALPATVWAAAQQDAQQQAPQDVAVPSAEVSRACHALIIDYAFHRDRLDAAAVADLFTEDAVVTVNGEVFVGREAIFARIEAERGRILRHMMSTIKIFQQAETQASGVSYVTVHGGPAAQLPIHAEGYLAIGEYHDRFEKTAEGWKISQRTFVPIILPSP